MSGPSNTPKTGAVTPLMSYFILFFYVIFNHACPMPFPQGNYAFKIQL